MDYLEIKHSVSCSLQGGGTSIVKIYFRALKYAGVIVFINLFDLYQLDMLLEATHLRFHENDSRRRAEHKLDLLQGATEGRF